MTTRIVILGGGFGGIYTALELENLCKARSDIEITLVNRENFMLFTPMLHEIAASDLDPTDIVNPIHKLLRKVRFFCGGVDRIDLEGKRVTVSHGDSHHSHDLPYDHLVVGLGSVTHFFNLPGLAEHALTMRSLGDAIHLRNQMIGLLEEADFECCKAIRNRLLTFVVAGGGFAGVETVAAMNDFVRSVLSNYPNLTPENLRVVLVNSGGAVLPELDESLGRYAGELLQAKGVEIHFNCRVAGYTDKTVLLSDGSKIESCTLVWTAGNAPHPHLDLLEVPKERGRLLVTDTLEVKGVPGLWALGDSAAIPDPVTGGFHPPTAQHAMRQGKILARNILAITAGKDPKPFRFKTLGQLASLGHRRGVAQVLGFRFSGFIAWWLWRCVYLSKLPRFEKKFRVAVNWTLDVLFSKDTVKLPVGRGAQGV